MGLWLMQSVANRDDDECKRFLKTQVGGLGLCLQTWCRGLGVDLEIKR